jgi:hypothetical protein
MSDINNDARMREAIAELDVPRQRALAARFIENVLSLTEDERVRRAITIAAKPDADEDQLSSALRGAKAAALDAHARCGSDGEWNDQAGYFVARAAEAAVAPQVRSHGRGPAWQAALNCRMARTAEGADTDEDAHGSESQAQYRILNDYLNP